METMEHFDAVEDWVKANKPEFNLEKFYELDMVCNTELWHGPVPEYWADNPTEHCTFENFEDAMEQLREMCEELPYELFVDTNCDIAFEDDPEDDMENWSEEDSDESYYPTYHWVGPDYTKVKVLEVLLFKEVYSMI